MGKASKTTTKHVDAMVGSWDNYQAMALRTRAETEGGPSLTVSSKRQVTLPAAMFRELGLRPGDKLVARIRDGTIVLKRRPKSLVEYLDSFPPGIYGATKEEIDANIAEGRRDRPLSGDEEPESGTL